MNTSGGSCGHLLNRNLRPSAGVSGWHLPRRRLDGLLPRDGACSINGLVPAGWDTAGPADWQGVATCELHGDAEILEEDTEMYQGKHMLEPMLHSSHSSSPDRSQIVYQAPPGRDSRLSSGIPRPSDSPVQRALFAAPPAALRPGVLMEALMAGTPAIPPPALPILQRPGATLLHSFGQQATRKGRHLHAACGGAAQRGSASRHMQDFENTLPSAELRCEAPTTRVPHGDEHHIRDVRRLLCLELTESQLSAEAEAETLRLQCQQLAEQISQAETQAHYVATEPVRFVCRTDLRSQLRELSQEVEQLQRIPTSVKTLRQGKEGKRSPLVLFPAPRLIYPD